MLKTVPVVFTLLLAATVAANEDRIVCPRVLSTDASMRLQSSDEKKDFVEVSGLGFSPTLKGPSGQPLFYAVNDGGGGRRLGIFDSGTGERLKSVRMPRSAPLNLDYEGLTVGPCGIQDGDCIYIADVGDNPARNSNGTRTAGEDRQGYPIYKIQEFNIDDFEDNGILPESIITTLWFNYLHPTSPTRYADCEAVFLDTVGWGEGGAKGDFYLITKWEDYGDYIPSNTLNRLFKIPAQAWTRANEANNTFSPEAVGFYGSAVESNALMGYMWTRGEMTRDGTLIALGDYYDQFLFLRCPGMSVAETLAVKGTKFCQSWPIEYRDSQFETIAWAPDKSRTLEISECYGSSCNPDPPMVWTTMDYTYNPEISVACPATGDSLTSDGTPAPVALQPSQSPVESTTAGTPAPEEVSQPSQSPISTTEVPLSLPTATADGSATSATVMHVPFTRFLVFIGFVLVSCLIV